MTSYINRNTMIIIFDTIYNIFGTHLEDSTDKLHLIPNVGTYNGRNSGGVYCPGIMLSKFSLTL